ncbi:molybdopterin-binding protein [Qipengyuania pelagi]|jgi:DMSO/TMAO reductase YedYZ molybdopterin-dependent catalytic subunit|uniref:Molybdopterin-dependent oxidoreductase n=1 Tax=Qipengyuania pelagi TaxID=994320 RepID=A0A844Y5B5_9SPHN|nr:molybdopterin-binding protein [Qipengyuania pelagi]MXO53026.1 molybdopterin-dependent oxidoreductase [Qipengyuania pelagi]
MKRRNFLVAAGAAFLAGCNKVAESAPGAKLLSAAESWHKTAHRFLTDREALAPEYPRSAISPYFRGNGSTDPTNGDYQAQAASDFADWRLEVRGLVETPLTLTLDNIRRLPQRTQVTRHDCVEGWSAIGEWTGPQLSVLLEAAKLRPEARYIVFRCADELSGARYYESVDLVDAYHPQTIIAHRLNGEPLPIKNGAPLRMRIERQLGYKHAKYLTAIEAVASLDDLYGGHGGYWEDRGYQWYAGI